MVPRDEIENLLVITAAANEMAASGNAEEGYRCIVAGLRRAARLHGAELWSAALVEHYRKTLARYSARWATTARPREAPVPRQASQAH